MIVRNWLLCGAAVAALVGSPAAAEPLSAEDAAALRAQVEALRAQVDALEARLNAVQAAPAPAPVAPVAVAPAAPAPAAPPVNVAWRGAPEFSAEGGWSFKPRGRLLIDTGNVSAPAGIEATTRNLGYNTRVRRVRLGFEGTVPGGFGYKVETDLSNASVGFGDVWITYAPSSQWLFRAGNFEPLNGMEQISSSNYVTTLERASFNEAFLNNRRLGAAIGWHDQADEVRVDFGLFANHAIDSSLDNDGWQASVRATWAPAIGEGRLHLGASLQLREFSSNNGGIASTSSGGFAVNQLARYRTRPGSALTDVRFVDTTSFAASSDRVFGLEAAAIFPGFYAAGEMQWLNANAYAPGSRATGLDAFTNSNTALTPAGDPSFSGGYAEIGWFITGETRGFGKGLWQRTRVRNPVSRGGMGAWQLAARYDWLDLNDSDLTNATTTDFSSGATTLAALNSRLGRGGSQSSLIFGVNWQPIDYVRLMVNWNHTMIEGGPLAAIARPTSTDPVNQRSYSVDTVAARMQIDF